MPSVITAFFHRSLDRIDAGLACGSLEATLPDGSRRTLGGRASGPVAIVDLKKWRALVRLANSGSVGWYDAWAAGEWTSPDPVPLFDLFMRNRITLGEAARAQGLSRMWKRLRHAFRSNSTRGSRRNIEAHYDLGNDFYAAWLDPTMSYSSAIFDGDETLEAAQRRKMSAIATRVAAGPGKAILDVGCGWGSLARMMSSAGAQVTGITLSPSQLALARTHNRAGDVEFKLQDYRHAEGQYDGITSVEMVEAVGQEYWPAYLDAIASCLKPGGRAAIQFISIADDIFDDYSTSADFIQTYVFPGGMLISQSRFRRLAEERGLAWQDQADFGQDYARTLALWRGNFDTAVQEGRLPAQFDRAFVDLWRYYLMYCEGGFRGGGIDVSQVTLVKV